MSIKISGYDFEGPYDSVEKLYESSGVYVILCLNGDKGYDTVDVGGSDGVKTRVSNHDRKDCWQKNSKGNFLLQYFIQKIGLIWKILSEVSFIFRVEIVNERGKAIFCPSYFIGGFIMGDTINSKNQSGGMAAKTINIRSKATLVAAISAVIGIAVGIKTLFFSKEGNTMRDETKIGSQEQEGGITARDVIDSSKIEIRDNHGPVQYNKDSPGSSQIVNQKRLISPNAKMERSKKDNDHLLRVTLIQLPGFWDEGTKFELGFKASGPYKEARIVSGLPAVRTEVVLGENKEEGLYSFSMRSAPLPDTPIILEVLSEKEINMEQFSVVPIAK